MCLKLPHIKPTPEMPNLSVDLRSGEEDFQVEPGTSLAVHTMEDGFFHGPTSSMFPFLEKSMYKAFGPSLGAN